MRYFWVAIWTLSIGSRTNENTMMAFWRKEFRLNWFLLRKQMIMDVKMSCVNSRCRKTVLRTTKIAVQYSPSLENYFLGFQYEILMIWLSNHKIKYHEVTSIILRLVIFSSSIITLIIIEKKLVRNVKMKLQLHYSFHGLSMPHWEPKVFHNYWNNESNSSTFLAST